MIRLIEIPVSTQTRPMSQFTCLPSEAAFLRRVVRQGVPVGSRSLPIKWSLDRMQTAGLIHRSREHHHLHWECWHATDAGANAIAAYDAVTLEETFR